MDNSQDFRQALIEAVTQELKESRTTGHNGSFEGSDSGIATNKVDACVGKNYGDPCSWIYNGIVYHGRCVYKQLAWPWDKGLNCSDVFKTEPLSLDNE